MNNYRLLLRDLPNDILNPYPMRLLYLGLQTAISLLAVLAILYVPMAWPFKILLSLVIGHCWGMNGLAGHEILHGSVVRNRNLQDVLGFIGFLPFLISFLRHTFAH